MAKYKAIALCRVSTKKQRIEGSSLEAQEKRVFECADYLDAEIEKYWSLDTSSRKGKNLARKDLHEMFEYCKKNKKIRYIIVDEADRFMRAVDEAFWWKVEFKQQKVFLAYANMPDITHSEDPIAVMREMMAFFQAEASNHERITKARDKMQAKIDLGYYPGVPHYGYKKSDTKSLHIPDEPKFSLMREVMQDIAAGKLTLHDARKRLQNAGLPLDMDKLKRILQEPYYCGTVSMGSFKQCDKGLHQPMITVEEFEIVSRVARGVKAKFSINRHNPRFPLNGLLCEDCALLGVRSGKYTGYRHHNGKKGSARKHYERYHCRNCGRSFMRDELHDLVEGFLKPVRLTSEARMGLQKSLRVAWAEIERDSLKEVTRLESRLNVERERKSRIVLSLAENPELKDDLREILQESKERIASIEQALESARDIETDFNEFVDFSLDFVGSLNSNWWTLDHRDRDRCEELIFPQRLRITKNKKVSTPEISAIYRYEATKKTPVGVLDGSNGGPAGA